MNYKQNNRMKKRVPLIVMAAGIFCLLATASCRNDEVITFRSLLKEMADPEAITRFPDPGYRLVQFSSYDRLSIHPDSAGWFANNDYTQFIREEATDGRREYVMLEAEGPGAVVRWWMTFGNANALNSYIRVYIDGRNDPVIEGMAPALLGEGLLAPYPLSSSVSPLTEPQRRGYNLYLPIPFSEKCIITLENDSIIITPERRLPSIYYNIGTRLYEEGIRVESARSETFISDTLAIAECISYLLSGDGDRNGVNDEMKRSAEGVFAAGEECSVTIAGQDLAVSSFTLSLSAVDTAAALKGAVIRLSFDGRITAEVPAGDFFGTGYTYNSYRTLFTATDPGGTLSSYRLMPFRDSCTVSIFNGTPDSIGISAEVTLTPYRWDESSMHFGASWREYPNFETAGALRTGGTGLHPDVNIAELSGRGVYAGDAITMFNTADAWWGEGDEKIYVDGEMFPSSFGTGTEDYFGYAWCRPEHFDHPLIAQPAGYGNFHPGMSVNMRYRILDAIPFSVSLKADLEMWHWVKTTVNFSLTSFYYLAPQL
jgi:hypothetical protein